MAEQVGVEHRGGRYDGAGALRDMIQNHLLQVLCLVAMEPMVSFQADEVRNKKVDVLRAVRPVSLEQVADVAARGQYGEGWIRGERVVAYRSEPDVAPESAEALIARRAQLDPPGVEREDEPMTRHPGAEHHALHLCALRDAGLR